MKRIFDIVPFLIGLTLLTAPAIIIACVLNFGERHPVLLFQEPHLMPDECFRQRQIRRILFQNTSLD